MLGVPLMFAKANSFQLRELWEDFQMLWIGRKSKDKEMRQSAAG